MPPAATTLAARARYACAPEPTARFGIGRGRALRARSARGPV